MSRWRPKQPRVALIKSVRHYQHHHASSVLHIFLRRGADTSLTPATRAAAVCVVDAFFFFSFCFRAFTRHDEPIRRSGQDMFFSNISGRLRWHREVFKISLVESGRVRRFSNPTATGGVALTVSDRRKAVFSFHHVSLVKS